jgi:hypothetical protein
MKPEDLLERRLRAAMLTAARVDDDCLVLADAVMRAAIEGSYPLTRGERAALAASPLTIRRFRTLSLDYAASLKPAWRESSGMLRAADSGAALTELVTDDGYWTLHFLAAHEPATAPRVILQLHAQAPFARQLLADQPLLRVIDGAGAVVLQGRLDPDGECESAWPFDAPPARHFQRSGAVFAVEALPG